MNFPNFLIIGAPKAGTTSLYSYLSQHDDVFMSLVKEPHFFSYENQNVRFHGPGDQKITDSMFVTNYQQYCHLFDKAKGETALGEASALYLYNREAAQRIKAYFPDMKLIAILRNPVDRAYSNYMHLVRDGRETEKSFLKALELENERIKEHWMPFWFYKEQGFYWKYLKEYLDIFPKQQVKILLYEDFSQSTAAIMRQVFTFLSVNPDFAPDISLKRNISGIPRNQALHNFLRNKNPLKSILKPLIPDNIRENLVQRVINSNIKRGYSLSESDRREVLDIYKYDIQSLEKLIHRDLSVWLK